MPRGDGTGPTGMGPMTGGKGTGRRASGGAGSGRGRTGEQKLGTGGECVCPQCGTKSPHDRGVPCRQQKCHQCGAPMVKA
jgi:hypothetical protein